MNRRDFVKSVAVAGVVACSPVALAAPKKKPVIDYFTFDIGQTFEECKVNSAMNHQSDPHKRWWQIIRKTDKELRANIVDFEAWRRGDTIGEGGIYPSKMNYVIPAGKSVEYDQKYLRNIALHHGVNAQIYTFVDKKNDKVYSIACLDED